ncbi:MAG: heme-binding protein [Deltaproteobacteria bacterium]
MSSLPAIVRNGAIFVSISIFNLGCSVLGIHSYETPKYEVVLKEDNKEIRRYEPYIVAKTTVKGEFKEAQSAAFKILAGYIFGDNTKKQKISMTGPVVQKPVSEREKIPMTGPVIQIPSEDGWIMTFMMPSSYTIEDLPAPTDKRVSFDTVPARYTAAIRYTWLGSKTRNEREAAELKDWLSGLKEYEPISAPMYAGYDPPWTLPFFRRNEMMIDIRRKQGRHQPKTGQVSCRKARRLAANENETRDKAIF